VTRKTRGGVQTEREKVRREAREWEEMKRERNGTKSETGEESQR
jgi:hypothetical protein